MTDNAKPVARVASWTNGSYSRNYKLEWLRDVPEGTLLYAVQPPQDERGQPVALSTLTDADYNEAMARVLASEKRGSPAVQLSVALLRRIIAAASAPALQGEPRIFRDGNQWCAVGPGFKNLQESPAGFGDTPDAALYALSLDTPGNRNPECRYAGYKGEALPSNATDDQKAAWQEGKRASLHADLVTCNHCSGSGKVKHDDSSPTQSNCPHCDGEGAK